MENEAVGGGLGVAVVVILELALMAGFYAYFSYCLMVIAQKTGQSDVWLAWIPIVSILLMCRIAGRPLWWILLFLIPCVNIVIAVIVWMGIAEARGKPNWWGILMVIPCVNLIVPGYLAFSD